MFKKKVGQTVVVIFAVLAFCSGANAEKTVYKWVDEDGQVHFGDAPPENSQPADTETLVIPKSPVQQAPTQPVATPAETAVAGEQVSTVQQDNKKTPLYEKTDVAHLSLTDLDLRCDEAREKMIAPLRAAEIEKCKQDKREDPEFCERFNADFGEGGRNINGSMRPRMFDDLSECVEANEERNRRGR